MTSASVSQTAMQLTRSSQYWFDDGNIVLVADGRVAFRVHRGMLAHHSSIFGDLFSVPQPADGKGSVDGCPAVHLADTPVDIEHLLRALYNGFSVFQCGRAPLPFPIAASLLELAHKYNIEALRTDMLARLRTCFCHTYAAFQKQTSFELYASESGGPEPSLRSDVLEVVPSRDAIRAVNLVRLVDEKPMLPLALYLCVLLPGSTLVAGTALENGRSAQLSTGDLVRCIDARARLVMRRLEAVSKVPSGKCNQQTLCAAVLLQVARLSYQTQPVHPCHVLAAVDPMPMDSPPGNFLCAHCITSVVAAGAEFRRGVWANLPGDLGLEIPEWDAVAA